MKKIKDLLNKITTETVKYSVYKNANAKKAGEYDAATKTIVVYKRQFAKVLLKKLELPSGTVLENIEAVVGGEYKYEKTCKKNVTWCYTVHICDSDKYSRRESLNIRNYFDDIENEVEVLEEDVDITNILENSDSSKYSHIDFDKCEQE